MQKLTYRRVHFILLFSLLTLGFSLSAIGAEKKSLCSRFLSALHLKKAPLEFSSKEIAGREKAMEEVLDSYSSFKSLSLTDKGELIKSSLPLLHKELQSENRLLSELSPKERKEILEEIAEGALKEHAQKRDKEEEEAIAREVRRALKRSESDLNKVKENFTTYLLKGLSKNKRLSDASPSEQAELTEKIWKETTSRVDAVKERIANDASKATLLKNLKVEEAVGLSNEILFTKYPSLDFASLPSAEKQIKAEAAVAELFQRLALLNKVYQDAVSNTGKPWNWQLMWQKQSTQAAILKFLHNELEVQSLSFENLSRLKRKEMIRPLVEAYLSPYQRRPDLKIIGVGLGGPMAFAYTGAMLMPEELRPAFYAITSIIAGPFTFGLTYWMNGKLKPLFALKTNENTQAISKTNFEKQMEKIGAASPSVSDPFKDGRNITKDSELALRDSLNDAMKITDESDARNTFATALVHHTHSFPEVTLSSLTTNLLFLKVKNRFANDLAIAEIQQHIRDLTRTEGLAAGPVLMNLDKILKK